MGDLRRRMLRAGAVVITALSVWLIAGGAHASAGGPGDPAPLSTLPVPTPSNEGDFVRDQASAVKLGKALFWDMQAGSDGRTACATCHYNAGADNRARNQVNPVGGSFTLKGPNLKLTADAFPFHKLSDPNDPASTMLGDTSNVSGSQGVLPALFDGITPGEPVDDQTFASTDAHFTDANGTPVRRSAAPNRPPVLNAAL